MNDLQTNAFVEPWNSIFPSNAVPLYHLSIFDKKLSCRREATRCCHWIFR